MCIDRQMQATTIPKGLNWPQVKIFKKSNDHQRRDFIKDISLWLNLIVLFTHFGLNCITFQQHWLLVGNHHINGTVMLCSRYGKNLACLTGLKMHFWQLFRISYFTAPPTFSLVTGKFRLYLSFQEFFKIGVVWLAPTQVFNSMLPSDGICHRWGSALAQVTGLLFNSIKPLITQTDTLCYEWGWHAYESNFTGGAHEFNL